MSITIKFLEELGVDKDVAQKIFEERSKEIEADKAKREKLENELKETKTSLENLTSEIETLKASGKNAEEVQAKLDALIAERDAEKKQAEADRILKEKQDGILKRFDAVINGKEFNHEAIKAEYLKKFGEAIELDENKAKSDADIFHELTKDDASAFKGVTAVRLAGGGTNTGNHTPDEAKARAIMGLPTK